MDKQELNLQVDSRTELGLPGAWYPVCKSVEVKDSQPYAATLLGHRIVLWRNSESELQCIEDRCPHRGAPLSLGEIHHGNLSCRYHGIVMTGEGVIQQVPAMPKCALEGRKTNKTYSTYETCDAVFVYVPSVSAPEPLPFNRPYEFDDPEWTGFLCTAVWKTNYRLALDNLCDPMHGCYLHAASFTLAFGSKQDLLQLDKFDHGFKVSRIEQSGENFDWIEMVVEDNVSFCRLDIPYPPAAGPGGHMRIVGFVTPVDAETSKVFFWRLRKVTGLERDAWRFMYRARLEERHWNVLEQDRVLLEQIERSDGADDLLYQHDLGVSHMRQILRKRARSQIEAEVAAEGSNA